MRKNCSYDHDIPSELVDNETAIHDLSVSTGRCVKDMVIRGSCSREKGCSFEHAKERLQNDRSQVDTKFCLWELEKEGSCRYQQCKFSHIIPLSLRNNDEAIQSILSKRNTKTKLCINEFRAKGSCWKKNKCHFDHNITEKDRQNPIKVEEMKTQWEKITKNNKPLKADFNNEALMNKMVEFLIKAVSNNINTNNNDLHP